MGKPNTWPPLCVELASAVATAQLPLWALLHSWVATTVCEPRIVESAHPSVQSQYPALAIVLARAAQLEQGPKPCATKQLEGQSAWSSALNALFAKSSMED